MPLQLLLVRHGQSTWNAAGRWQGQADPPLTPLGEMQAMAAARALGSVDAIACSSLERAWRTAGIIATELGVGPLIVEPDLIERDAGEWSGLTRRDIHEQWAGYLERDARPPSYEPEDTFRARIFAGLDRLATKLDGQEAVVVAHSGVIYAIEASMGAPFARMPNLGGRRLSNTTDGWTLGERVILVDEREVAQTYNDQL